ncbi:MAG: branched-chain amino acid ABC transporter substrate-binding protein [Burkholderiaceae bacterium]
MKRNLCALACSGAFALALGLPVTAAAEVVKIGFIDPLSGPLGNVGQNQLKSFQFLAEKLNEKKAAGPDTTFEIVAFDNKASPQESLTQLKAAQDQGIRYVTQGNGSGAAGAIIDAINKFNERNPDKTMLFMNYAAVDPDLTNSKCSFWHFRFDADTSMKMEGLTTYMAKDPKVKKVYIIGQNYAHGVQVAKYAKELLARKRPDIQIVGEDLTPIAQTKDFAPYIAKIKASGADTVITGNWGADLTLLIKAAKEANLEANFYTYYAGVTGTPTVMGASGAEKVKMIAYWHNNVDQNTFEPLYEEFKKKYNDELYVAAAWVELKMLADSIKKAKSTDPTKVAFAMEGMEEKGPGAGEVTMRKTDHQLQMTLYIATWTKAGGKLKHDVENTGYTFRTDAVLDPYVSSTPTSCQMKRPAAT